MKKVYLKKLTALALAAAIASSAAACGGSASSDSGSSGGTLKIAVSAPLTGTQAEYGKDIQNGVELAAKLKNEAGGINGKTIEVTANDDKGDPSEAATIANKLVEEKDILAVVGNFGSSCTLAAAPIYNQGQLVTVSPSSSAAAVTDAGDYVFRTITTDAEQGKFLTDWAVEELGLKNIAVLYENTDFGIGVAEIVEQEAEALGASVVAVESYENGDTDYSTVLTKIANANPDALVVGGFYSETAAIAKQSKNYGLEDVQLLGVDSLFTDDLIDLGGEDVEGFKVIGYFSADSESEATQTFVNAYREAYNEEPGTYAAYAYDAALVILDALENGGEDRVSIQEYLSTLQDFPGATGTNSFDENGDVLKDPLKLEVIDGAFNIIG